MKLTAPQIAQIKDQIGADPVPDNSPTTDMLAKHFGEHTFYVDQDGLHIFQTELTETESGPCNVHSVRVASWTNEKRDALERHDPVAGATTAIIDID